MPNTPSRIVKPGRKWADRVLPILDKSGRSLARTNLDVNAISQDLVDEVFKHIPRAERAGLRVGKNEMYRIMGVVGTDVQDWFRFEAPEGYAGSLLRR